MSVLYTGAVNQTAHITTSFGATNIGAFPFVCPGGIVDALYMEVTSGTANAVARFGIYKNLREGVMYPGELIVDSGEKDFSSNGVKSTTGLSVVLPPGLYWTSYHPGVATSQVRAVPIGALSHMMGMSSAFALYSRLYVGRAYSALPATFPTASPNFDFVEQPLVGMHFSA